MSTKISAVSFNIRTAGADDGCNSYQFRQPHILKAIREKKPDIIGFQEVMPYVQDWLGEIFGDDYVIVGYGREKKYDGESNPVMFRRDSFKLFSYDQFWLSETPYLPGSRYENQSGCPRICVAVTLKHKDMEKPFRFYNTHLDHVSDEARRLGLAAVLKRIGEDNAKTVLPYILTGDFNASPDSGVIEMANSYEAYPMYDACSGVGGTFHAYGKCSAKIDYIFTNRENNSENARLWDECVDGVYISDHYPIEAEIIL